MQPRLTRDFLFKFVTCITRTEVRVLKSAIVHLRGHRKKAAHCVRSYVCEGRQSHFQRPGIPFQYTDAKGLLLTAFALLSLLMTALLPVSAAPANSNGSFTVIAWVKTDAVPGAQAFVSRQGQGAFALTKRTDDRFAFALSGAGHPDTSVEVPELDCPVAGPAG